MKLSKEDEVGGFLDQLKQHFGSGAGKTPEQKKRFQQVTVPMMPWMCHGLCPNVNLM